MKFTTRDEFEQKVVGSICLVKGVKEKRIAFVSHDYFLFNNKEENKDQMRFYKKFDYKAPPLGYTIIEGDTVFVSRKPARVFKVGLFERNANPNLFNSYPVGSVVDGIHRILNNDYPPIGLAITNRNLTPVSRKYAVSSTEVCHEGRSIASIKGRKLTFDSESEMYFHHRYLLSLGLNLPADYKHERDIKEYNYDYDV